MDHFDAYTKIMDEYCVLTQTNNEHIPEDPGLNTQVEKVAQKHLLTKSIPTPSPKQPTKPTRSSATQTNEEQTQPPSNPKSEQEKIRKLTEALDQQKICSDKKMQEVNSRLARANEEISKAETEITDLDERNATLQKENSTLKTKVTNLQRKVSELEEDLRAAESILSKNAEKTNTSSEPAQDKIDDDGYSSLPPEEYECDTSPVVNPSLEAKAQELAVYRNTLKSIQQNVNEFQADPNKDVSSFMKNMKMLLDSALTES